MDKPAFLPIKNVELAFTIIIHSSAKGMCCVKASFTVERGVSERVLSKV
jgi:hypothetical protein